MIVQRKSEDRGQTNASWLKARHSFSFNRYYDPEHTNFGPLVVLNHDYIAPGGGFPPHPHDNMEIVTYILEGALEHKDSMGTQSVIHAGEVQRMTAGTGVMHSEFNHSHAEPVRLLQIWFYPDRQGYVPSYQQIVTTVESRQNILLRVAGRSLGGNTVHINQEAVMYISKLIGGMSLEHPLDKESGAYLYLIDGKLLVNKLELDTGDAAMITDEDCLFIEAGKDADFVLFDVQMNFTR